jgi:hypothetical protein
MVLFVSKAKIEAFAAELSQSVVTRYPPELVNDKARRPSEVRLTRIVEDVCQRAVAFRDEQGLGWLGKARLGNAFRWQMADKGYRKDFVDLATEALIVNLSRRPDSR